MIVVARNLAVGYPGRVIGEGFAVDLAAGDVVALLGPNGGGKTTLLKTLLGLLPPKAGTVLLDGRPLGDWPVRQRARLLAYVPQGHAATFAFTVEEVVTMGRTARTGLFARPSGLDRAVVRDALDHMGVAHLADRPYTMISGGERQLCLIARALAQEPRIVVLDEPTASLDFGNQGRVLREIRRLAADGLAVLFSTHDPNHALRFADRAVLIRDGGTLASGPAAEIIEPATLARLYGAPVEIVGTNDVRAFLPG